MSKIEFSQRSPSSSPTTNITRSPTIKASSSPKLNAAAAPFLPSSAYVSPLIKPQETPITLTKPTNHAPSTTSPSIRDVTSTAHAILKQIEYYFSNANLVKDTFLQKEIAKDNEQYVPLSIIAAFPKVAKLTQDPSMLILAIKQSSWLQLSPDQMRVKRAVPFVLKPEMMTGNETKRTLYAHHLPAASTLRTMRDLFTQQFGTLITQMVPCEDPPEDSTPTSTDPTSQPTSTSTPITVDTPLPNGLFVEFDKQASCKKAIQQIIAYNKFVKGNNGTAVTVTVSHTSEPSTETSTPETSTDLSHETSSSSPAAAPLSAPSLPQAFLGMHVVTKSAYLKKHHSSVHHPQASTPAQTQPKPLKLHLRDPNNWRLDAAPDQQQSQQQPQQQQQQTGNGYPYGYGYGYDQQQPDLLQYQMQMQALQIQAGYMDSTQIPLDDPMFQQQKKKKTKKYKTLDAAITITTTTTTTDEPTKERPRIKSSATASAGLTRASGRYAIGPDDPGAIGFAAGRGRGRLSVTASPTLGSRSEQKPMPSLPEAVTQDA